MQWSSIDINIGQWVTRAKNTYHKGWMISETYKIGYLSSATEQRYVLINIVDGCVGRAMTKQELIDRLNGDQYVKLPFFVFMRFILKHSYQFK